MRVRESQIPICQKNNSLFKLLFPCLCVHKHPQNYTVYTHVLTYIHTHTQTHKQTHSIRAYSRTNKLQVLQFVCTIIKEAPLAETSAADVFYVHFLTFFTYTTRIITGIISTALGFFAVGQFAVKKEKKTEPNLTNIT